MTQRRKLVDAIAEASPTVQEREFVFEGSQRRGSMTPHPTPRRVSRTPLTTRLRDDYAHAVKRVSLERQLDGIEPNSVQDILEEALAAWLKVNGEFPGD